MNTHHRNDPSSPWGGMGSSGVGSENGIGEMACSSDGTIADRTQRHTTRIQR